MKCILFNPHEFYCIGRSRDNLDGILANTEYCCEKPYEFFIGSSFLGNSFKSDFYGPIIERTQIFCFRLLGRHFYPKIGFFAELEKWWEHRK